MKDNLDWDTITAEKQEQLDKQNHIPDVKKMVETADAAIKALQNQIINMTYQDRKYDKKGNSAIREWEKLKKEVKNV